MQGALIYDFVMRLPLALLMIYNAISLAGGIYGHFAQPSGPQGLQFFTGLAALIAMEIYVLFVLVVTLLRMRPVRKLKGFWPRFAALAAGVLPAMLAWLPKVPITPMREIFGTLMILAGMLISVYCLGWLGRSFSLMPEARRLVTGGPYSFVRHPLYTASVIQSAGIFLLYLSLPVLVLFVFEMALQVIRIHYEERVLRETFPEYEEYSRRTTIRLLPGVY